MNDILGNELGRGGYGIVYIKKDDETRCIKVSTKTNSCRQWSNEYKKIKTIVDKLKSSTIYNKLKTVKLIIPNNFIEEHNSCYMVMPRVFRPEGKHILLPTIQAFLGTKSCQVICKGRGEILGLKEILKLIPHYELMHVVFELGMLMGHIHFVAKNDAYDVEVYLGKDTNTKKNRLYLADFDLSEEFSEYTDDVIERIAWSLDAVPYFPRPSVDIILFNSFKEGYVKVAMMYDIPMYVIEKIFENYD